MKTCYLIIGTPRSGSSCLAGVLHKTGIPMTLNVFEECEEVNPMGLYEDKELTNILSDMTFYESDAKKKLASHVKLCAGRGVSWGAKTFMLAYYIDEFIACCPDPVKIIHSHRSVEKSTASAVKIWNDGSDIEPLYHKIKKIDAAPKIEIDYDDLLDNQHATLNKLSDFIGQKISADAIASINPALRSCK